MQVFDSFELMAGEEVEQVILAALRALVAQAEEPKQAKEKERSSSSSSAVAAAEEEEEEETTCDSSYPDNCIPPPPPDLTCDDDVGACNFEVVPPDPHGFDGNDNDGIGCESGSNQPDLNEPDNNSGST